MRMRMRSDGSAYCSSVHWSAVLESISELKTNSEREGEERTDQLLPSYSVGPRLFYGPVLATKDEILASLPARSVVDRLVARYFNAQGVALAVVHSGAFLREYDVFWCNPGATSYVWLALLFGIMGISTQLQQSSDDDADPHRLSEMQRVLKFRECLVQSLVLGQFTRGGPHVLEAMIHYCALEVLLSTDAEVGLWLLLGTLVQLAISQGYHRDPAHLPNLKISVFAAEMRRRVWAAILQMDLRISGHMGLPRVLKSQLPDTAEPRNLLDSDFDEATTDLPPSRPESEVTPVLFGLAKSRIDRVGVRISDLVANTTEHPHHEILDLDRQLRSAEAALPPVFRWRGLGQSLTVPPQIVFFRIWLQLSTQRLVIWLHRKYLAPSYAHAQYGRERTVCVEAAIKILEFQQLLDDETRRDGLLYAARYMMSSVIHHTFLLGMSVLCYYIQLARSTPDVPVDRQQNAHILTVLRNTWAIWLRSSPVSRDAWQAVEHLSRLPGLRDQIGEAPINQDPTASGLANPYDGMSLQQATLDAYQEYILDFPAAFGTNVISGHTPSSFATVLPHYH